ncbi:hypothetical protein LPJ53_004761 [Coemansia erecta]|uniref:Peptidase S1 domain-containing protein n=1 Tax=Coemansia erecta TaxID=147472 RepID=A0A9W7XYC8_9FUNG|nr:hypothetical protein LPJ53_004761 [Coemansia erecta]
MVSVKLLAFVARMTLLTGIYSELVSLPAARLSRHPRLMARATASDLDNVKAGVLVKDGTQTSCALGLLDNKASLISADCLDFSNGSVDKSVTYEAYINAGWDGVSSKYTVANITVHPNYDERTKANNIALIQFNTNSNISWYNYNAVIRHDWSNLVYVQYSLSDIVSMKWNTPTLYSEDNVDDTQCGSFSPVYNESSADYVCSKDTITTVPSGVDAPCRIVYGMVYGEIDGSMYPAGFLSHVAVKGGNSLCSFTDQRAYYTLISDYLMFATTALNREVYYYSKDNVTEPQQNPYYAMEVPSSAAPSGVTNIGGNIYAKQAAETPAAETPVETPVGESHEDSGLSSKTKIIIGVCSALGGLILLAAVLLLVRWWRKHGKIRQQRDPYKETTAQEILAGDLGGASVPNLRPSRVAATTTDPLIAAYERPPPAYRADENPDSGVDPQSPLSPHPLLGADASSDEKR